MGSQLSLEHSCEICNRYTYLTRDEAHSLGKDEEKERRQQRKECEKKHKKALKRAWARLPDDFDVRKFAKEEAAKRMGLIIMAEQMRKDGCYGERVSRWYRRERNYQTDEFLWKVDRLLGLSEIWYQEKIERDEIEREEKRKASEKLQAVEKECADWWIKWEAEREIERKAFEKHEVAEKEEIAEKKESVGKKSYVEKRRALVEILETITEETIEKEGMEVE